MDSSIDSTRPVNNPASRYTQRAPSRSETSTTSVSKHSGVGDDAASRLGHQRRRMDTEMPADRCGDRRSVLADGGTVAEHGGREPAAQIDNGQVEATQP